MTRRANLLAAVAIVVAATAAAACGVPDDNRPRVIAAEDAPLDLEPATPTLGADCDRGSESVDVFFIERGASRSSLRSVRRCVPDAGPETALRELLRGLTATDPPGLVSAIPPDTVLNQAALDGDTLTIDLGPAGGGIQSVTGTVQLEAFAQFVRTATAVSGVARVRFAVDGDLIAALTDAGATATPGEPVTPADYLSLRPG